jgi:hypothetical protein
VPPRLGAAFPNRLEAEYVALAEVQETFRVGERDILTTLRGVRTAMVEDLMQRLRDGKITTRNLKSQRRSGFKGTRRAEADLRRVFKDIGKRGAQHVVDELERQEGS